MKYLLYLLCYGLLIRQTSSFFDNQVFEWLVHYQHVYCQYDMDFDGGLRDVAMVLQVDFCFLSVCFFAFIAKLGRYLYKNQTIKYIFQDIYQYWKMKKMIIMIITISFFCALSFFDISAYSFWDGNLYYMDDYEHVKQIGFHEFILTLFTCKTLAFISILSPFLWFFLVIKIFIYWGIDHIERIFCL